MVVEQRQQLSMPQVEDDRLLRSAQASHITAVRDPYAPCPAQEANEPHARTGNPGNTTLLTRISRHGALLRRAPPPSRRPARQHLVGRATRGPHRALRSSYADQD